MSIATPSIMAFSTTNRFSNWPGVGSEAKWCFLTCSCSVWFARGVLNCINTWSLKLAASPLHVDWEFCPCSPNIRARGLPLLTKCLFRIFPEIFCQGWYSHSSPSASSRLTWADIPADNSSFHSCSGPRPQLLTRIASTHVFLSPWSPIDGIILPQTHTADSRKRRHS